MTIDEVSPLFAQLSPGQRRRIRDQVEFRAWLLRLPGVSPLHALGGMLDIAWSWLWHRPRRLEVVR